MSRTLLDILTTLTFRERNYILSLLDHTEIIRLSACNHSLREIVCNNNVLWRKLYKCHFLSGAYRTKEWEFVFWCFRTDPNTISVPARRSDVVNNVDWYNTYRRRIATENNWRHSYSNTTEMDIEMGNEEGKSGVTATYISATCVTLSYNDCESIRHTSDLKHDAYKTIFLNGHYVIGCKRDDQQSETTRTAALLSRGSKDKSTYVAIDIPPNIKIKTINGKWALLCDISTENYRPKYAKITMLDMENAIKHSSSIDDVWDATCFYETNDRSAMVTQRDSRRQKILH
ncbi:hypothetical protein BDF22DRAFT_739369 [Syncephalis plumigaleata]|nr:hypothetical protein BDF22DRAFT_739369 [Syncephalis plumigaleata]